MISTTPPGLLIAPVWIAALQIEESPWYTRVPHTVPVKLAQSDGQFPKKTDPGSPLNIYSWSVVSQVKSIIGTKGSFPSLGGFLAGWAARVSTTPEESPYPPWHSIITS